MIRGLFLEKKYHICHIVDFFPALIFLHRILWIFLQNKTKKIPQRETVVFDFKLNISVKIVGDVL